MEHAKHEIGLFALVLAFFTRIPLPATLAKLVPEESELSDGANYFPVVGLLIGLTSSLVLLLFAWFVPMPLAAGLALAVAALLTGALHEDGLADCADGFGGSIDRQRAIEIMSDSRIGTYGTLSLVVVVGLKWLSIAAMDPLAGMAALLIAHTVSRAAILLAPSFSRYAKPDGLGRQMDRSLPVNSIWITLFVSVAVSLLFAGWWGLAVILITYSVAAACLAYFNHRLGGYTGDGLGCMQQLGETAALITLAGAWA